MPGEPMSDKADSPSSTKKIAAVRANLLELTEQAAAQSGAADEELAAERIARQERLLAALLKQRGGSGGIVRLGSSKAPRAILMKVRCRYSENVNVLNSIPG